MVLHGVSPMEEVCPFNNFPWPGSRKDRNRTFFAVTYRTSLNGGEGDGFSISCLSPTQSLCFRVKHSTFLSRLSFHYNSASRFSDSFPLQINSGSKNVISHYSGRILQLVCGSRACWTTFCHTKRAQTLTHTKPFPAYLSSLTLLRTKKKQWN